MSRELLLRPRMPAASCDLAYPAGYWYVTYTTALVVKYCHAWIALGPIRPPLPGMGKQAVPQGTQAVMQRRTNTARRNEATQRTQVMEHEPGFLTRLWTFEAEVRL
jgi:hypothetical protein